MRSFGVGDLNACAKYSWYFDVHVPGVSVVVSMVLEQLFKKNTHKNFPNVESLIKLSKL